MRAWASPVVPDLPWKAPEVKVFDTASEQVRTVVPATNPARLYVCGITPYDATHLGHANTYLTFDLLNRAWRSAGHTVRYVQNVTDIDDPLLERAAATGQDWVALAERETELFRTDMTALRVLPPDAYVGAVESIPLVIDMIERLEALGAVYRVDDDLYFDVHSDPDFGQVSSWPVAQMLRIFPERGGDPDRPGKRDPLDCLLWLAARPGEPSWDSPFGPGRPGWHVECSAIARAELGTTIDVQGGGSDLICPHHEMSAGHAQVADERPFARAYVHAGMVGLDGEKMSKSKGNLELVSRLRGAGADPMAVRLALLRHHYRSDWEWTADQLARAESDLALLRTATSRPHAAEATQVIGQVLDRLADDLDAPGALDAVFEWAAQDGEDTDAGAQLREVIDAALGLAL